MKFKFSFEDHDEVVENDTYAGALNYVINGDVSILGWIKNTYKKVGDKWVMIYGPRLFNKTKEEK